MPDNLPIVALTASITCLEQVIYLDREIERLDRQRFELRNTQQSLLSDLYVSNLALSEKWILVASENKAVRLPGWNGYGAIEFDVLDIVGLPEEEAVDAKDDLC